MKIPSISEPIKELFEEVIFANELDDNKELIYQFSDPDGERSGKSGWSFGKCQFDIANNPNAVLALREMDFTTDEIKALRDQTGLIAISFLNMKLMDGHEIVDKWDNRQVMECLEWPLLLCNEIGVELDSVESFLHIADYHNQLYFSRRGKLYNTLKAFKHSAAPSDILAFKLSIPWGIKKPKDVYRRYKNIRRICNGNAY